MFACAKPVVAAVQGPAIGGGLGVALVADFRVTCAEAKFSANFNRLGFHPGFGLSATLPRLVGVQKAAMLGAPILLAISRFWTSWCWIRTPSVAQFPLLSATYPCCSSCISQTTH